MKKVKIVKIKSELTGYGIKGIKREFSNINERIEKMIEKGCEYCGFVPNTIRGAGEIEVLSLIFQKDVDDNKANNKE